MPIIWLDYPYLSYGRLFFCPCPNILHDLKQANLIKQKRYGQLNSIVNAMKNLLFGEIYLNIMEKNIMMIYI